MKNFLLLPLLVMGLSFAQKVADDDPLGIYIPEGSYMFNFCLEKNATICAFGKAPNDKKYSGMKGKLTSLSPILVEYGKNNVFEIKMDNGDLLYYSTKNDSPFKRGGLINLKQHTDILNSIGSSLIEGGSITISDIEFSHSSYKYTLSSGHEFYETKIENIKRLFSYIPLDKEESFIKMVEYLDIEYDPMEDRFFIYIDTPISSSSIRNSPAIAPYIGFTSKNKWLRLKLFYGGDNWLFSNKVLIKIDDNRTELTNLAFTRDHSGGTIWETIDKAATEDDIQLIKDVISSDETTVRFYGRDYYGDRDISIKNKKQLDGILTIFEMLNIGLSD